MGRTWFRDAPRGTAKASVIASVVQNDLETLEAPHIVHVVDPYLDVPLVFGPFVGPGDASVFAEGYRSDVCYEGCEELVTVTIVPLRSA